MLLRVGQARRRPDRWRRHAHPTTLHDVFFRVGGPHVGKATVSLEVNSDDVDPRRHLGLAGRPRRRRLVGWTVNTADTGVIVNGDNVTATGLFVEHFQQYNVIWNGEHGQTIFFQNELPYDPPNQAAWQHDGLLGWAAYKVGDRGCRPTSGWGWAATSSPTSTRPSTPATASRCRCARA